MNWKESAEICEVVYGCYVNWKERYFICPECDEPIYECDFNDFTICPVCEFDFIKGE